MGNRFRTQTEFPCPSVFQSGQPQNDKVGLAADRIGNIQEAASRSFLSNGMVNKRPTTSTTWKPSGWSGKAVTLRLVEIFNGHRLDLLESAIYCAPSQLPLCYPY
jgi:hypothetical protein